MKIKPTQFWCSCCDANLVDSEKPETGKFFQIFGHQHSGFNEAEGPVFDGDYHSVLMAICKDCNIVDFMNNHCAIQDDNLHCGCKCQSQTAIA